MVGLLLIAGAVFMGIEYLPDKGGDSSATGDGKILHFIFVGRPAFLLSPCLKNVTLSHGARQAMHRLFRPSAQLAGCSMGCAYCCT